MQALKKWFYSSDQSENVADGCPTLVGEARMWKYIAVKF